MPQRPSMRQALTGLAATLTCAAAAAAPAWITLSDDARELLRGVAPQATVLSSQAVPVRVPSQRGSRNLVSSFETVHAVEIDDAALPGLSQAVHESLHRCGGFVRHESMAEALAVLHRLQTPQPEPLAPSYAIDDSALVTPMLAQMQSSRILSTIQSLSDFQNRMYNSSHGVAASDWLFNQWTALAAGRSDIKVTRVKSPDWPQASVSLVIKGSKSGRAERVVLGGHLDSISSGSPETLRAPGADDDASGVASLTEVIRVLLANNYKPKRTLEFFAYSAEEVGLLGSQRIASNYAQLKRKVVGVLQLDMTAFQGDPTDLWIFTDYTNAAQNTFVANLAAAYLPQLKVGFDRCGYGCSDHASWNGEGFAASFPFEASFAHDNPAIHTPSDTVATFGSQAEHALKFSRLALGFAVELGSD